MRRLIKQILRKKGLQIRPYPEKDLVRRMRIVNNFKIDTLFDIGANFGQYALLMRELGYSKKIISFEPLKVAFEVLKKASSGDNNWEIHQYALGSENAKSLINVAANSGSSSILNMLPAHIKSAPEARYIDKEEIEIKKLDAVINSFCSNWENVMIKIDTQGYEKNVLDGAEESLKFIKVIQLEMSLVPLYENEILFLEMINHLSQKGFELYSLENGFSDKTTGQLLQVDGIFCKKID